MTCTGRAIVRATRVSPRASSSVRSGVQPSPTSCTPTAARASKTCGAMPSPQHLSRGKSDRSSSSTRSAGSAASAPSAVGGAGRAGTDHHQVPATRGGGHRAPTSSTTSTSAIPIAARNGPRPRPTSAPRRRAHRPGAATAPPAARRPRCRPRSRPRPAPAPRSPPAGDQRAPTRCGSPRTPVARVVAQVGQRVDEVRADPEQRAGDRHPQRRQAGRPAGEVDEDRAARRTRRRTAARTRRWT